MNINDIKKGLYEGYFIYADSSHAEILRGEEFRFDKNKIIVEGLLYDRTSRLSYSICYADGRYFISEYQIEKMVPDSDCFEETSYAFSYNKMTSAPKNLKFIEKWKEVPDEYCLEMSTLEYDTRIFIGFE